MAKLVRFLTLPAPKRRRTDIRRGKNGSNDADERSPRNTPEASYLQDLCYTRDRELRLENMRFVLLQESEHRMLFDTDAIIPLSHGLIPGARTSPDGLYQFLRHGRDTKRLGHMLFGSMAANNGMGSVKIHALDGDRILVSRVFSMPFTGRKMRNETSESAASSCESDYGCQQTVYSLDGLSHACHNANSATSPPENFAPLGRHRRSRQSSLRSNNEVEEEEGSQSSEWDELRALSPPHRVYSRTRRNEALPRLSLQDDGCTINTFRVRFSTLSADSERTVGMGVILSGEERAFVLQHMPLFEIELYRLEKAIRRAATNTATFIHNLYQSWRSFSFSMCVLHNTPRLRNPVWMHLLRRPHDLVCTSHFCTLLAELTARCDTKQSGFFLSNVVSAVLMHHMSWIASVAPPPMAHAVSTLHYPHKTESPSSLHGCNPHLAQLLEVSGCVGGASRSARTVICGTDPELVCKLLHVLSYFIRCSSVEQKQQDHILSPSSESVVSVSLPLASPRSDDGRGPSSMSDSSHSSFDSQSVGGMAIPGPSSQSHPSIPSTSSECCLGESLLAGPSYHYSPHFILSGLLRRSDNTSSHLLQIVDDLNSFVNNSESETPDPVVIIADCSDWTVKVLSGGGETMSELHSPAECVAAMLESFTEMHAVGVAPSMLLSAMEDAMSDILNHSISLVEMVEGQSFNSGPLTSDRVRAVVGCDVSDLRLLLNVASVYCPEIMSTVA